MLFDLPKVVEGAHTLLGKDVASGRCRIEGGDFCSAVPSGADAYLLKRVLVVLDDNRASQVLRNRRRLYPPTANCSWLSRTLQLIMGACMMSSC